MSRAMDWWLLLLHNMSNSLEYATYGHHLTTDPACVAYRLPRAGSNLDIISRGQSCVRCMIRRAFTEEEKEGF